MQRSALAKGYFPLTNSFLIIIFLTKYHRVLFHWKHFVQSLLVSWWLPSSLKKPITYQKHDFHRLQSKYYLIVFSVFDRLVSTFFISFSNLYERPCFLSRVSAKCAKASWIFHKSGRSVETVRLGGWELISRHEY